MYTQHKARRLGGLLVSMLRFKRQGRWGSTHQCNQLLINASFLFQNAPRRNHIFGQCHVTTHWAGNQLRQLLPFARILPLTGGHDAILTFAFPDISKSKGSDGRYFLTCTMLSSLFCAFPLPPFVVSLRHHTFTNLIASALNAPITTGS